MHYQAKIIQVSVIIICIILLHPLGMDLIRPECRCVRAHTKKKHIPGVITCICQHDMLSFVLCAVVLSARQRHHHHPHCQYKREVYWQKTKHRIVDKLDNNSDYTIL